MLEQELTNLQKYIGKRSLNQTDEEVIEHINKINNNTPLTEEEWKKLLIPCCNNGQVKILNFILEHISNIDNIKEYMIHTVYGRYGKTDDFYLSRIEVLKILMNYISTDKEEILNETMIEAAWFGETSIVKFLIENGANKEYKNKDGIGLLECSERVEKQFKDISLKEYIK